MYFIQFILLILLMFILLQSINYSTIENMTTGAPPTTKKTKNNNIPVAANTYNHPISVMEKRFLIHKKKYNSKKLL